MLPDVPGGFPGVPFLVCAWMKCGQIIDGSGGILPPLWMVGPP